MARLAELAEEAEADPFAWPQDVTGPFDLEGLGDRSDEDVVKAQRRQRHRHLDRPDAPHPQVAPPGHPPGRGHRPAAGGSSPDG
jgi:hypothetical protein